MARASNSTFHPSRRHNPSFRRLHLQTTGPTAKRDHSAGSRRIRLVHAIGEFLRECGYIVLDSSSPKNALKIAEEHPGRIDILVTDVVMPGLCGPELHRKILELQPEIQALFMSGYAEGLPEMQLPEGARFLQKPFRFSALLESLKSLVPSG